MVRWLVAVAFFALAPARADACMCAKFPPDTPEEALDASDDVIRARVTKKVMAREETVYTMRVTHVYKGRLKRGQTIEVHSDYSSCGVGNLREKIEYALAPAREGDHFAIGMCGFHQEWR